MLERLATRLTSAILAAGLVAYALIFALNIVRLAHSITWDGDAVSTWVLADAVTQPHGTIYLSNHAQDNYLAIDALLRALPAHHTVWEFWLLAVDVASVLVLGAVGLRTAGPWAALAVVAGTFAVAPTIVYAWMAQAFHGLTYANTILLLALAVAQARTGARRGLVIGAVVLGLVTGLDVVSDALLAVTGLAPYILTSAAGLLVERTRRLGTMLVPVLLLLATAAGALVTELLARHLNLADTPLPVHLTFSHLQLNLRVLGESAAAMVTSTVPAEAHRYIYAGVIIAVVLAAAAAATLLLLFRTRRTWPATRRAALTFCCCSVLLLLAAFLFTDAPVDATTFRYLVGAYLLVVTAAAILATKPLARVAVSAAILAVAVVACTAIPAANWRPSRTTGLDQVIATVQRLGVVHGYADYWQANPATFNSDGAVTVRPVVEANICHSSDTGAVCPFDFNADSAWFRPKPGRSFMLTDPYGYAFAAPSPRIFGPPSQVLHVGVYAIYVYPYDIASRMLPPAD